MQLNAPKTITWWIGLILGAIGVIGGSFESFTWLNPYAIFFLIAGWLVLVLGTFLKGL